MRGKLFQNGNSKMEHTSKENDCLCITFSLPSLKTCPFAGGCKLFCFASCGTALLRQPKEQRERNLIATLSSGFVNDAITELIAWKAYATKKGLPLVVRLHDSGDIYSKGYLGKLTLLMGYFPDVLFYAYTKSHRYLWDIRFPLENFLWVPSLGGVDDYLIFEQGSPYAKPVPESYQLQSGEVFGSKDDLENLLNIYQGKVVCLLAHGAKKRSVK